MKAGSGAVHIREFQSPVFCSGHMGNGALGARTPDTCCGTNIPVVDVVKWPQEGAMEKLAAMRNGQQVENLSLI